MPREQFNGPKTRCVVHRNLNNKRGGNMRAALQNDRSALVYNLRRRAPKNMQKKEKPQLLNE
jgi:hypothetical protein